MSSICTKPPASVTNPVIDQAVWRPKFILCGPQTHRRSELIPALTTRHQSQAVRASLLARSTGAKREQMEVVFSCEPPRRHNHKSIQKQRKSTDKYHRCRPASGKNTCSSKSVGWLNSTLEPCGDVSSSWRWARHAMGQSTTRTRQP